MNNELTKRWTVPPRAGEDAVGAALRRAVAMRLDRLPGEFAALLTRLESRGEARSSGAQAAMSYGWISPDR